MAGAQQQAVTLRNDSERVRINWDAVPDSVMRMLAAALLDDYNARQEREKAAQAERS